MWNILKFELKYRFKRPATYIYFAILFLMAFCAITTDVIQVGGSGGQVKENAPTTIAFFQVILSVIPGLLLASAVMGVPILRDFEHKTASMLYTTPMTKTQYLGGRFLGSLMVTIFIFSGILLGMMFGYLMPWIEQDKLLPYNLGDMLHPFFVLVIPNIFIMACLFFASGTLSRKLLVVFVQGIFLFIFYAVATELMDDWENQDLGALLDPFGLNTVNHVTRYWTVAEQNTQTIGLSGLILWNRLLWVGIALATLLFTFWKFDYNLVGKARKKKKQKVVVDGLSTSQTSLPIPSVQQQSGLATQLTQIWDLAKFYFN